MTLQQPHLNDYRVGECIEVIPVSQGAWVGCWDNAECCWSTRRLTSHWLTHCNVSTRCLVHQSSA